MVPPINPVHMHRYFGDLKGFGVVDELVKIVTGRVPVHVAATGVLGACDYLTGLRIKADHVRCTIAVVPGR